MSRAQQPALASLRCRGKAVQRVPVCFGLAGILLLALQTGQPVVGFAIVMMALVSTATIAWRSLTQGYAPSLLLREQADARLTVGHYSEARALYERSLAIVQRELPPTAPEILVNYYSLAAVNTMLRDHARADEYLEKLYAGLGQRIPAQWLGNVAWITRRVAHHHSLGGRHARAIELCTRARELVGDAPGADDITVRSLVDDLAWIQHHAGSYPAAEQLFRRSVSIHEQYRELVLELAQGPRAGAVGVRSPYRQPGPAAATTSGGLDRALAYSLLGLGWTRYERGDYQDARAMFKRAGILIANSGGGRLLDTSEADGGLIALSVEISRGRAAVEMTLGNYDLAQRLYEDARRRLLPHDARAQRAALAIDFGWLARCREDFSTARAAYDDAERCLAGQSEGIAAIACALHESRAELNRREEQHREGFREVQRALALADACFGPEHPRRATLLAVASRILTARSECGEAERLARTSLQILRAAFGNGHVRLAEGYVALAEVQLRRGQFGAAERSFHRALELREASLGPQHPELVEILSGLAAVQRATAREDLAAVNDHRIAMIRGALAA